MNGLRRRLLLPALFALLSAVYLPASGASPQQPVTSTLRIEVLDQTRRAIQGALVVATSSEGLKLQVPELGGGIYELSGIKPGSYEIRIEAADFVPHRQASLLIPGTNGVLTAVLRIQAPDQQVFVTSALPRNAIPEFLGGVRVLRGEALNSLPDSEGALLAYLRLLAPRSSGPFGPSIFVDGFSAAHLPPKASIREIRINDNPFSAEYSQVGLSRVEIFTKPGTETWQSTVFFNFNDESLNSRNVFAPNREPFQHRTFGLNFGGPIVRNGMTFLIDAGRVERDDNTIINATTIDSGFNVTPLIRTLIKPARETHATAKTNYQLGGKNTLAVNLRFAQNQSQMEGVGDFSLESRAYESLTKSYTLQVTETATLHDRAINETRLQLQRSRLRKVGDDSVPTVDIPQAFVSGGSEIGNSTDLDESIFLSNLTTWARGNHTFKGGAEARAVRLHSQASTNLAGTYVFTGRVAPQLDANGDPVLSPGGEPIQIPITNLESYRRTLLLRQKGLDDNRVRELGGGASLFSVTSGGVEARVRQYETAAFLQDDWRARSNLSLLFGVRFETQNNLRRTRNFAPRFSIAWEPSSGTVIRSGSGIFHQRVAENLPLHARLLNGNTNQQFFTADPRILSAFPGKLSTGSLSSLALSQTVWRLAPNLSTPYDIHSSFSFEQVLPLKSTLGLTLTHTRGLRALRTRNVNAPLPEGTRPEPEDGEIFQIESSGRTEQKQLILNTTHNLSDRFVIWTTYTLSEAFADTDGPFTSPANIYDLSGEYGYASSNARHTFYAGGWFRIFGGIELTPLVMWRSGLPFNITTGRDDNGDTQFTERPGFAADLSKPSVIHTQFGSLDLYPEPGQALIPRNFGAGPAFRVANLRITRYFRIGGTTMRPDGTSAVNNRLLTLALQVQNLFNNSNYGTPVGNLSSPLFGRSTTAAGDFGFGSTSAGTRRIDFTLAISF